MNNVKKLTDTMFKYYNAKVFRWFKSTESPVWIWDANRGDPIAFPMSNVVQCMLCAAQDIQFDGEVRLDFLPDELGDAVVVFKNGRPVEYRKPVCHYWFTGEKRLPIPKYIRHGEEETA